MAGGPHSKENIEAKCHSFFHLARAWALTTLPSWFHWCTVEVAHYTGQQPMVPHSQPRDGSPLSAVVELGDFRGGGLWMECGGKLRAPKYKTTREVVQVVNHLSRDVQGVVCSARKGLVLNSGALLRPWDWKGDRWSIVLYNGADVSRASLQEREELMACGFAPCGQPCDGWHCGSPDCN